MIHPYTYLGLRGVAEKNSKDKVENIKEIVCKVTDVDFNELISKSRKRNITEARQLFHYFVRRETNLSLTQIGQMTNRDHSSVIHSINFVNDSKFYYPELRNKLTQVNELLVIEKTISNVESN